ncbi:Reticulon-domain-containing protein [Scheffersomyces xylosifermentans]|uniref:Reticulon-domain-containing protein n=1 Tax=Scheffersomyces xylosifermentans TaxID=1304137 RepID=UPI00315DFD49
MSTAPIVTPPSSSSTCSLLTWKDPVLTGKVFGSIIVSLIVLKYINLINLFFRGAYVGLLLSAAAEYAGKLVTGQGFVTKYKPAAKSYAKQFNDVIIPQLAELNLKIEEEFQKIIYSHDIETTLKAAGLSYILYKLTSWFTLFTLIAASVVILFTVPVIYQTNKKEIDAAVANFTKLAKNKTAEYTSLAHKAAAPHIETIVKSTGPVGKFVKSKFPTRTAGSTVGDSKPTFGTAADELPSATTTGSSKFPDVPSASLGDHKSTVEEFVDHAPEHAQNAQSEFTHF